MSWSFDGVGKPDALKRAMTKAIEGYTDGQSRKEFESAATHLGGLLDAADQNSVVDLHANGHETWQQSSFAEPPKRTSANISVTLKQLGKLCE